MLIGKNSDQVIDNPIFVDKLKVEQAGAELCQAQDSLG